MPCSSVSLRNEPRIVARSEASTIEPAQVSAAIADGTSRRLCQAEQQAGEGGLARAALADHGDDRGGPGLDRQRQPGESESALAPEPAGKALADVDRLDQRGLLPHSKSMEARHDLFAQQVQGAHHAIVRDEPAAIQLRQDAVDAELVLQRA